MRTDDRVAFVVAFFLLCLQIVPGVVMRDRLELVSCDDSRDRHC